MKYAWVARHKGCWPTALSCEVLGVSASGYFEHWRKKGTDNPIRSGVRNRLSDEVLLVHIKAIYAEVKGESRKFWLFSPSCLCVH